jgi:hypothetical protein
MTYRTMISLWERVRTIPFSIAHGSVVVFNPQGQGHNSPSRSVDLVLFVNRKDQW